MLAEGANDCPASPTLFATTVYNSTRPMKETPMYSVHLEMMSSKLALPLNVVRTLPPPLIASPFPVTRTRRAKTIATISASPSTSLANNSTTTPNDTQAHNSRNLIPRGRANRLANRYAKSAPAITCRTPLLLSRDQGVACRCSAVLNRSRSSFAASIPL